MFGIGMPEMILILAIALIVIGPKKLPDLAKSLGKAMGEFKKATSDLKESMQIDTELKEVKTAFNEINRKDNREPPIVVDEAGETGETAGAAAGSEKTTDAGKPEGVDADSMDTLKMAFDRQNEDAGTEPPTDGDSSSSGNGTVSETREG
jgi:TatA/E family protein of Tat protein translocase